MLRPETDVRLLETEQFVDLILEPGDLAVEMDKGPTRTRTARNRGFSRKIVSKPITLKPFLPTYSRREAKRSLGLGWRRHCLVSLGGAFGDWDLLKRLIVENARKYNVGLIWAQSPLAPPPGDTDPDTVIKQFYPLSRYMKAFDGMITASGYNSYHELMMGYDGPVLLAPTNNVRLDDQEARATWAGQQGWAQVVLAHRLENQEQVIESFMQQVRNRAKVTDRPKVESDADMLAREIFKALDRYR